MSEKDSVNRREAIRESFSQALGLRLKDSSLTNLIEGKSVPFEELSENHTLTELGTALIRLEALRDLKQRNSESETTESACPVGCSPAPWDNAICICIRFRFPEFHLLSE